MSSFWNLFKDEKPPEEGEAGDGTEADATAPQGGAMKPSAAPKGPGQTSVAPKPTQPAALPDGGKPPPVLPPARTQPRYGIDEAIRLMRTLPVDDNPDLVVRVIKRTLESLSVKVHDIIEDAGKRQESLRSKISEHQAAIVQLEREIDARRFDIGRLEDELSETSTVRERLQLAEQLPATPNAPRVGGNTPQGSSAITGSSSSTITAPSNPPPSAQKKPPLPTTTFRPKPTVSDLKKPDAATTAPATPTANKEASAAFPAPPPAKEESKEKKDEPSSPTAKTADDDDDDDDEPVESRDLIEKIEKTEKPEKP